jgi:hypothetical protein
MQIGEQALQALICVLSTQSIRIAKSTRCRAFKRVAFCELEVKFPEVERFVPLARMVPVDQNFCAAVFLGGVLMLLRW